MATRSRQWAHVIAADPATLAPPPDSIPSPESTEGTNTPLNWRPAGINPYLNNNDVRSRLKLLYDSTAKDLHEHGSYVFADSVTHRLYTGR